MKMFVITKQDLFRLFKYVGIYLVALSIGAFTGLLPLLALVAGLPIILADRQMGRRAAQIVALVSLAATWLVMGDPLSFVYVGLGLIVGFSLSLVNDHVPFRFALVQTGVAGFIWALVMNFAAHTVQGTGLLSLINTQFQQAVVITIERMQGLNLYTAEQISQFQQYVDLMRKVLIDQWAYILFIYLLASTLATYILGRALSKTKQPQEDLLGTKAPIGLGAVTAILAGLHYLLPAVSTLLVTNLWNIVALIMSLFGFMLLFYYLRFLRGGIIFRVVLGIYLFSSPIAWRVLLLVGLFDAVFDYRFYARNRQQGQPPLN